MDWYYKGRVITELPDDVVGFVYVLFYDCGKMYIGKKLTRTIRKLKPTKAQLAIRKNYVRKETVFLPWLNYEGSSEDTKGLSLVRKEIIALCYDKINLTYCEVKHLVKNDVLTDDAFVNSNILGKFFKGKIR